MGENKEGNEIKERLSPHFIGGGLSNFDDSVISSQDEQDSIYENIMMEDQVKQKEMISFNVGFRKDPSPDQNHGYIEN